MNSHKHLSLSQALAPILQNRKLESDLNPLMHRVNTMQGKLLSGWINLLAARVGKRSILEVPHQKQL